MRISKASSWYNYVKRKSLQDLLNYIKLYSAFLKCCCKIYFMINSATCIFNKVKFYSLIWIFCKSKRTAGSYYSSFRRPTLLDSPIPIFEFRGRGGWPKKFRGGRKLRFFISFNVIFNFKSTSKHVLISLCLKNSLKWIKNTVFQPPLHF